MEISDIPKLLEELQSFFQSSTFDIVIKAIFIYFGSLWVALIIWVTRDAINRSNSLLFHVFAICLNIILPVFGLIIYLIIRPSKPLLEKYFEELEYTALTSDKTAEETVECGHCKEVIEKDYLYCPFCTKQVKKKCSRCHKSFNCSWSICPYCGHSSKQKKKKK